jgi:Ion channel
MVNPIPPESELTFADRRFLTLFIFLLATLIFYPYAEASRFGYFAFRIFASAAILLSIYAAKLRHRGLLFFALALAVPALLHRIFFPLGNPSLLSISNMVLSFAFDIFVVVVIFRHVFSKEEANSEAIFAALCIYLLVGFSFASVYGTVATFQPNSFYLDPRTNLHVIPDRFDFVYYSFGTMTSLGATGITPVSAHARAVTILEAILGVLYLAVLIARLMVGYTRQRR